MGLPKQPRAVVTGAGSGLGRALCVELARRQARVVVSDVNEAAARETARLVEQAGAEARVIPCDVTKPEQVEALARESEAAFGGVDLLVNNAGVACGGAVGSLPLADWKYVLDVNLWGVIHGCHYFVPLLRRQQTGHILNIASAAGLMSAGFMAPYNASKAAVVSLSETLYQELRPVGVGVSVACPMFFRTNIALSARYTDGEGVERLRERAVKMVEGAKVQADEVARDCVRAVERDAFYVLPMASGRWFWRFKRLAPEVFARAGLFLQRQLERSEAKQR